LASKTILIADDDSAMNLAISMRLERLGFSTMRSPDATHALFGAQKIQPDLIILDVNMPGGNGMAVCEMLASDPHRAKIPVIIHTSCSDEHTKTRCKELGARYVMKTPGSWTTLKATVCELLGVNLELTACAVNDDGAWPEHRADLLLPVGYDRERAASPDPQSTPAPATAVCDKPPRPQRQENRSQVLCIDDDPDVSKSIMIRLRPYGIEVQCALNGMQGFWKAVEVGPDVIILEVRMPDTKGDHILERFKSHSRLKDVPVIVLTSVDDPAMEQTMLDLGVDAYLRKPLVFNELLQALRRHLTC